MTMEKYTGTVGKESPAGMRRMPVRLSLTMICVFLGSCDPDGPGVYRFGSDGLVRVVVEVPLQAGTGWMRQVLTWQSDGAWKLFEQIGYDSVVGDENDLKNPGLPYVYAANYLSLLHLVNENRGTRLWGLSVTVPECGVGGSRVSFLIHDNIRDEQREWSRCASQATPLRSLSTVGVGAEDGSARVVQVAMRARDFTMGADFDGYAYTGSLPFATVERGTESGMDLEVPAWFRSPEGEERDSPPQRWLDFWRQHVGKSGGTPPRIDWTREMILVGAIGERHEVGDSAEVRRVLVVGDDRDIKFEVVERVPGDYCAPATRTVRPYHIVVMPRSPAMVSYGVRVERVPCGL